VGRGRGGGVSLHQKLRQGNHRGPFVFLQLQQVPVTGDDQAGPGREKALLPASYKKRSNSTALKSGLCSCIHRPMNSMVARLIPLQISLYGVRAEILAVRPPDAGKKEAYLPEIGIVLKAFEEVAPDIRRNIEYSGYAVRKNDGNFFVFKWSNANYLFHNHSNGLMGKGFCPLTASRQSAIRSSL